MSWNPIRNSECPQADGDSIETLIIPRARNLVCLGKETTQIRLVLHKVIGVEPRVGRHGFSSFFTLGGTGQR